MAKLMIIIAALIAVTAAKPLIFEYPFAEPFARYAALPSPAVYSAAFTAPSAYTSAAYTNAAYTAPFGNPYAFLPSALSALPANFDYAPFSYYK